MFWAAFASIEARVLQCRQLQIGAGTGVLRNSGGPGQFHLVGAAVWRLLVSLTFHYKDDVS
jgi:hypothetical protein